MTAPELFARFTEVCREAIPAPGSGRTPERHSRIFAAGREDLSLAKLAEAHWDAVAILQEAGLPTAEGARYAVWASEIPGRELQLHARGDGQLLTGRKEFCSGAGLVDRALITAGGGGGTLVEVDLRAHAERLAVDGTGWAVDAFRLTQTSAVTFADCPVAAVVGRDSWYTRRPGFWQGACGPAAAWAGGAAGLVDFALKTSRNDPHTAAHLAAMHSSVWATEAYLGAAGDEFDRQPGADAMIRALQVRHLVEQASTEVLRRFARCLGPAPLAKQGEVARRYAELDLFLRQSHAEQDLEALGRALRPS